MNGIDILKDIDPRKWSALLEKFRELAGESVVVGIPAATNARKDGAIGSAAILAIHEFGSPEQGIPERSVVRRSIQDNADKRAKLNARNLRAVVRNEMTVGDALHKLGEVAAGDVRRAIRHAPLAPLAEATVRRKGSSQPLIDKGETIQAITHEVRRA